MNLSTLSQGEPWMTPEERNLNREFIHDTTKLFAARSVSETPLLMLRINDVIVTWLLTRRLELALAPEPGEPVPCPTPTQAGAIGKSRDRLRRAMKELEASIPRDAAPIGQDLAERLLHVTQSSEAAPMIEHANDAEVQESESPGPDLSGHPAPAEAPSKTQPTTNQPETPHAPHTPIQSKPAPTQSPLPAPPHKHRSVKKCRKKRGIPIRAHSP